MVRKSESSLYGTFVMQKGFINQGFCYIGSLQYRESTVHNEWIINEKAVMLKFYKNIGVPSPLEHQYHNNQESSCGVL